MKRVPFHRDPLTFEVVTRHAQTPCMLCGKTFFDARPACDWCWVDHAMTEAAFEFLWRRDVAEGRA